MNITEEQTHNPGIVRWNVLQHLGYSSNGGGNNSMESAVEYDMSMTWVYRRYIEFVIIDNLYPSL